MASCCCLCSFQKSRAWLALVVPIVAVFARLSPGHGAFLIPICTFFFFFLLSTILLFTFSKRKPANSLLKEAAPVAETQEKHQEQENGSSVSGEDCSCDDDDSVVVALQDLYSSESESMDQFSSDVEQRLDCSDDGSISDEESLIEIEIPSGQFLSLEWRNVKCCKQFHKDFWAEINEFNEEDNLIEIDINMGSIKC